MNPREVAGGRATRPGLARRRQIARTFALAAIFGGIGFGRHIATIPLPALSAISLTVSVLCIVWLARRRHHGIWSFSSISLIVLVVFHLGAVAEMIYRETSSLAINDRWLHAAETRSAIWLATVCVFAFTLGATLPSRGASVVIDERSDSGQDSSTEQLAAAQRQRAAQSDLGAIVCMGAALAWLLFAARSGLTFSSSYEDYLAAKATAPLQLVYYLLGLGLVFASTGHERTLPKAAYVLFAIFAAIAFPIGLRGEVLFPLAAGLGVLAYRRKLPGWKSTLVLATALLVPITVVSQTRQEGLGNAGTALSFSPLAGLAELGRSLQVLQVTIAWHGTNQEPFMLGSTYWTPTVDQVRKYVLRASPADYTTNIHYMSTEVSERVGNIGGSVIAEGYHNFGPWGAVLILFLWGVFIASLENRAHLTAVRLAVAGSVAFSFELLVRNSWPSAPTIAILTLLLLGGSRALTVILPSRSPSSILLRR